MHEAETRAELIDPLLAAAGKLRLRFSYASNGLGVYAIDMQTGEEGPAEAFPSPDEL